MFALKPLPDWWLATLASLRALLTSFLICIVLTHLYTGDQQKPANSFLNSYESNESELHFSHTGFILASFLLVKQSSSVMHPPLSCILSHIYLTVWSCGDQMVLFCFVLLCFFFFCLSPDISNISVEKQCSADFSGSACRFFFFFFLIQHLSTHHGLYLFDNITGNYSKQHC